MSQSRQKDAWNHTADLLAMLANINRDPKTSRARQRADFHPLPDAKQRRAKAPPIKGDITMLKSVFVDRRTGG